MFNRIRTRQLSVSLLQALCLVGIVTCTILKAQADSPTDQNIVPGILYEKRVALLKKIDAAKQSGCGVASYIGAFNQLESDVKSGLPEQEVDRRINAISSALDEQKKRSLLLKNQRPAVIPVHPEETKSEQSGGQNPAQTEKDSDDKPYIAELERRVKRAWFPPKGNESKTVIVTFTILRSGYVSDLRIEHSCGVSIVDDAALKAVRNAQPFRPPPEGAKDPVNCEFTFDYKATHGSLR